MKLSTFIYASTIISASMAVALPGVVADFEEDVGAGKVPAPVGVTTGNIAGVAGADSPAPVSAPVPATPKSANKIGISKLQDEDNLPASKNAKAPLDPYGTKGSKDSDSDDDEAVPSYDSFVMSISMIIISEIGDKTFLIAVLMAMKHSRWVVFSSAFASLAVMTVLSGVVGHALPSLISRRLTQFLASLLFVVFGIKLLNEGLAMSKDMGVEDELAEVEEEIELSKTTEQLDSMEAGHGSSGKTNSLNEWYVEAGEQIKNLASFVLSPIWIQVFVMTFLGEWGDRSQIATIAMAAGSKYWFVILGAIVGHFICTAAACLGGKLLAKKISMRNVTLGGAIAFLIFSILYFYNAYYDIE